MPLFLSLSSFPPSSLSSTTAIELRLDLFPYETNLRLLKEWINKRTTSFLLTLRTVSQGGKFEGSRFAYEEKIRSLLLFQPSFIDLEWEEGSRFPHEIFCSITKNGNTTKLILSHHFLSPLSSPKQIEEIYQKMASFPAYAYKIAFTPQSITETFLCLILAKKLPRLSLICMGEKARFSRLLTPIFFPEGLQYAALDQKEATAKGQIPLSEMEEVYHYQKLNQDTALFALIGDPIDHSQGHLYHNKVFAEQNKNALYIKIPLSAEELPTFFSFAKECMIQGLSVTMPLKEKVVTYLDVLDERGKECLAINTIVYKKGKLYGTNTDGIGALDALEKKGSVEGKWLAILGTGGSARAIAFEAKRRKAKIYLIGRSIEKAIALAAEVGGEGLSFLDSMLPFDIVINTTPLFPPFTFDSLSPKTIVMDIVYTPTETPFLKRAKDLQCEIVYGKEMFFNQAARQQSYWEKELDPHRELCLTPTL